MRAAPGPSGMVATVARTLKLASEYAEFRPETDEDASGSQAQNRGLSQGCGSS
jgi:hypothetical protein